MHMHMFENCLKLFNNTDTDVLKWYESKFEINSNLVTIQNSKCNLTVLKSGLELQQVM